MLLCAKYSPPSQNNDFFVNIDNDLDMYSTYKKVTLACGFNVQVDEKSFDSFLYEHELTSIDKNPTSYKKPNSFLKTETIFRGLSDFHKLALSVFKLSLFKISYINFKD